MKVFLVGGAVRDEIMGREVKDRDYVVVGSSHEEMISLGYVQVGADFPVYLHPVTKEEYALARTERKVGEGYHGFETRFTPDVTLEDDLARRDLTINSIAKDLETGEYIDPFGGIKDIENKVLRATTKAFRDDPLRILRLFRFRARLGENWTIDHITLAMVHRYAPLVSQLPKERKFKEMEKCFEDKSRPDLYLELLSYYTEEFPEVEKLYEVPQPPEHHPEGDAGTHTMLCVQQAAKLSPAQVFAVACHDLGKVIHFERGTLHGHEQFGVPIASAVCDRMGVPKSWKRLALLVTEHHTRLHRIMEVKPKSVYNLIHALGGEKETDRTIKQFAECCEADAKGRGPTKVDGPYPQLHFLMLCSQDLLDNRKEISKLSAEIAEKWKGRPEMIASQVRALKISYVRRKMKEINTILNWEA